MNHLIISLKRNLLIPLLGGLLGYLCATLLAPLAIEWIVRILQPDYIRADVYHCTYGGGQDSPTGKG